jgi:hypothetical protein
VFRKRLEMRIYYINFLIIMIMALMFESALIRITGVAVLSVFYTLFTYSEQS